jgi:hypothetical protein
MSASFPSSESASKYHHSYAFGSFWGCQTSADTLDENTNLSVMAFCETKAVSYFFGNLDKPLVKEWQKDKYMANFQTENESMQM